MTISQPFDDEPLTPDHSEVGSAEPEAQTSVRPWITSITDLRTGIAVWVVVSRDEAVPAGQQRVLAVLATGRVPVEIVADTRPRYLDPAFQSFLARFGVMRVVIGRDADSLPEGRIPGDGMSNE